MLAQDHAEVALQHLPAASAGSGDKTIKKWSGNVVDRTFSGHTDSVRAICHVPGTGFLSASHDTTLRLWGTSGECVKVFTGHTSLVYACAVSSSLVVSGAISMEPHQSRFDMPRVR